jgi:hypothetical protein
MRTLRLVFLALLAVGCLAVPATADVLTGTPGADVIGGGGGDDTISGLEGNDRLRGGGGNDTLDGGPGSDDMSGGAGRDAVSYAGSSSGVTVSLDDLANDGSPGELDNAQTDIEDIFGGPVGDDLTGNAGANTLDGGAGDDRLTGGGGRDALFGSDGSDRLDSRDGVADVVDCGPGEDIALIDSSDTQTGCEVVDSRDRPRADGTVRNQWAVYSNYSVNTLLVVADAGPANATVELRCRGRGCPFARRRTSLQGRSRTLVLTRRLARRRLGIGARIEVRITAPGSIGKLVRFTMQRRKLPRYTVLCLQGNRPRSC